MSETTIINSKLISGFEPRAFSEQKPFPWTSFSQFLTEEGFQLLYRDFPEIRFFEKHENLPRRYNQRPHNRYYLAYEKSVYNRNRYAAEGVIRRLVLSPVGQRFIDELNGEHYRRFLQSLLGVSDFTLQFAWHIGTAGSEVSPHLDIKTKLATHIFYFNTDEDWSLEWGGETLVLCGKRTRAMNPDFCDFETAIPIPVLQNRSFLFKNRPNAWHGVRTIRAPEDKRRQLFNVIVMQRPSFITKVWRRHVYAFMARWSQRRQARVGGRG
jgi:hypothetical protein